MTASHTLEEYISQEFNLASWEFCKSKVRQIWNL